jgi:hypothetical protein
VKKEIEWVFYFIVAKVGNMSTALKCCFRRKGGVFYAPWIRITEKMRG